MSKVNVRQYERNGQLVSAHQRGQKPRLYRRALKDYQDGLQRQAEIESYDRIDESWVQKYVNRINEKRADKKRDRNLMASLPYNKQMAVHASRIKDWWNGGQDDSKLWNKIDRGIDRIESGKQKAWMTLDNITMSDDEWRATKEIGYWDKPPPGIKESQIETQGAVDGVKHGVKNAFKKLFQMNDFFLS